MFNVSVKSMDVAYCSHNDSRFPQSVAGCRHYRHHYIITSRCFMRAAEFRLMRLRMHGDRVINKTAPPSLLEQRKSECISRGGQNKLISLMQLQKCDLWCYANGPGDMNSRSSWWLVPIMSMDFTLHDFFWRSKDIKVLETHLGLKVHEIQNYVTNKIYSFTQSREQFKKTYLQINYFSVKVEIWKKYQFNLHTRLPENRKIADYPQQLGHEISRVCICVRK